MDTILKARVLIVDDDKLICNWIANAVTELGHSSFFSHTLAEGLRKIQADSFDVVFVDVRLPDGSGLEIIPKIKASRSSPEIIVITALGDPDEAERAIQTGAWDYLEKPASFEAIKIPILRALEYRAERKSGKPPVPLKRKDIIGNSQKIFSCLELLAQAAGSDANVLITGDTGTGKELFAKAIHSNSARAKRNFVVVDCTALPETLVESVLFGHARGAFTGAERSEEGLIKQADGGTLFLDEIGELPFLIQKRFLRVIQEHRFRPVGGRQEIESDFRLVAATNRNLESMVRQGRFREDLFFRLRTLIIELPPLKELPEDIKELTAFYINALCKRFGIVPKEASPEFWNVVAEYQWPGNVRELSQALEKALLSAKDEPMLFPKHLPTYIRIQVARNSFPTNPAGAAAPETRPRVPNEPPQWKEIRKAAVSEAEQRYLKDLISYVGEDVNKACRISGLSRSRFYTLLRKSRPDDGHRPV
ncbi:MAG: sigma-54 dependent transcriptional regulator [Candidatus Aminicenantes bacterium]|nr:sigma-54 dependent transcriptional regulator [Candidatus Aminicenantes bacterium]